MHSSYNPALIDQFTEIKTDANIVCSFTCILTPIYTSKQTNKQKNKKVGVGRSFILTIK